MCGVPLNDGSSEVLGNPRIRRDNVNMNNGYPVLVILLHLCHQVIHLSEEGPVIFHPLLLGIRTGGQGSVAADLFMCHELAEGQRRSRIRRFLNLGPLKATCPYEGPKKVR